MRSQRAKILNMLAVVCSGKNDEETLSGVLKKASYYVQDWPQNLGATDPEDNLECTSLLAAAISGQPARWFRDTYTGRSGKRTDWDKLPEIETKIQNFDQFFNVRDPLSNSRC